MRLVRKRYILSRIVNCKLFLMLSNGVEAKVGILGSKYVFFHRWKKLSE